MDTFGALMSGFAVALTVTNLMWGFLGVTLGTAIGVFAFSAYAVMAVAAYMLPETKGKNLEA